ncbi:P-loop NTPase [Halobaculum marinum]|uniref:P-loop NTPase n=1 Tax=Halobaculum marinum TaxID=3031996 RepID=A0ABD5WZ82_9EURY|nr:P-loop NTPase [Halobaculum sp. DT55]
MDGRVLAVVGAKGGVGKTTTSLNLAAALAEDGRAVAVVEADLAMANAVDFLDIRVNGGRTLHDVLAGGAGVGDATYPAPGGFDVVPSGVDLDGFVKSDLDRFPAAMDALKARYDAVLVDTAAGVSRETVVPMTGADASVLVSTPRVASIRDADKTMTVAERADAPVGGVVLTKSGTGRSPPADRIAEFLDTELLGHVPHDEAIPKAQDAGQPAISYRPHSEAATAYREVAAALRKRPDMLGMTVTTNTGGFRFGDGDDESGAFADGGDGGGATGADGFTNPFG